MSMVDLEEEILVFGPWRQADNPQQLWPICLVVGQVTSWYASLANLAKYEDVSGHRSERDVSPARAA
jgi:hypothetical protein